MDNTVYQRHGFKDRMHYFRHLVDEYDVHMDVIMTLAEMLGPNEDFDGLVAALEDM